VHFCSDRDMTVAPTGWLRTIAAGTLVTASALHVAWGRGSTFPFASDGALTANVVGSSRAPSPASCFGVAACLGMAAAVVAVPARGRLHQLALAALATGFATRATFGFAGRTDLLVPGSASPTFRRNDRRVLSPLCAALALGIAIPTWRDRPTG